jgi:hypothetical protein
MTDLTKIPVTVITGFLGAGKTTLIRHLMQNPQGKRLAILVNEFGTVGVDGDILKSCADENCPVENIVELANGCICCTVADDFIPTIEALMAMPQRPDHILIETSGLALPKPLLKAFDWPAIRSADHGGWRDRPGRCRGGRGGPVRPRCRRRRSPARRRPVAGPRNAAVGSVRGPDPLRRPDPAVQGRSGRGRGSCRPRGRSSPPR